MSPRKEKYNLCNITTTNKAIVEMSDKVRKETGLSHEAIYKRGLEEIIKESKIK